MKKIFYNFIVLFFIFVNFLKADISTGLVAHYEFENNIDDSSGNGYDLSIAGGGSEAYGTSGKYGKSYIFNGTDNYLKTLDNALKENISGTISFWIKAPSDGVHEAFVSMQNNSVINRYNPAIYADGSDRLGAFGDTHEYIADQSTAGDLIFDNSWHHVVLTFSGTGTAKFYVNGVFQNPKNPANENFRIGTTIALGVQYDNGVAAGFFSGELDDIRIYDRTLNSKDVIELYNYVPELTLKAHGGVLQFDKNSSNTGVNLGDNFEGLSSYSVEAWINLSSIPTAFGDILSKLNVTSFGVFSDGTLHGNIGNGSSFDSSAGGKSRTAFSLDTWYHVAKTWDGTNIRLYINGTLEKTFAPGHAMGSNDINTYIGAFDNNAIATNTFPGMIDEVRIWKSVRTQVQIQKYMEEQIDTSDSDLLAYYNFDERKYDYIYDLSEHNYNGFIEGNISRLNFLDDGLSFDGDDDYINTAATFTMSNSQSFSYGGWIKTSHISDTSDANTSKRYQSFFNNYNHAKVQNYFSLFEGNGKAHVYIGQTSDYTNLNSTSIISDGQYHYISVVVDRDNNIVKLYVDGILENSRAITPSLAIDSTANFTIGGSEFWAQPGVFGYDVNGTISEVSVWNKALNEQEIDNIMASSLKGDEADLIGYWPLNEGSGNIVYDKSSAGNNGTLNGGTWKELNPPIKGTTIYTNVDVMAKTKLITTDMNSSTYSEVTDLSNASIIGNSLFYSSSDEDSKSVDIKDTRYSITKTINFEVLDTRAKLSLKAHGGAMQFDGSTSISSKSAVSGISKHTIELNINSSSINTDETLVQLGDGSAYSKFYIDSSGYLSAKIYVENTLKKDYNSTVNVVDGSWHHVALKFYTDGNNSTSTKFVIDGIVVDDSKVIKNKDLAISNIDITGQIILGKKFTGLMDEVRIWDTTRLVSSINKYKDRQLNPSSFSYLLAYYNFDERAGNYLYDITGKGFDGNIDGSALRINHLGDSIDFDSTYVQIADNNKLDLNTTITMMAWIKPELSSDGTIFSKSYTSNGTVAYAYELLLGADGYLGVQFNSTSNEDSNTTHVKQSNVIKANRYTHVAVTYDGSHVKIYLNGKEDRSIIAAGAFSTSNAPLLIGKRLSSDSRPFKGEIKEASIWDKVLSKQEIRKYMHTALDDNQSGLVGYWPLNEGQNRSISDKSINSNNGTITNGIWIDTAPSLYGDKIYTSKGMISYHKLAVQKDTKVYNYDKTSTPSGIYDFDNTLGIFTYKADGININFDTTATQNNATLSTNLSSEVHPSAYIDVNITLKNLDPSTHNITNVILVGNNGYNSFDGSGSSWSQEVLSGSYKLILRVDANASWWYNFTNKEISEVLGSDRNFEHFFSSSRNYTFDVDNSNWVEADADMTLLGDSTWKKVNKNTRYKTNSITDNSSYLTLNVNKLSGDNSVLQIYQTDLGTKLESSVDINITSVDDNTFIKLLLTDDDYKRTQLLLTPKVAVAFVYDVNGNLLNTTNIYLDSDAYIIGKRIKLNTWFLDNRVFFNITDTNNNQIGKMASLNANGMSSFSRHDFAIVLDDKKFGVDSNVSVDFYGISSDDNISYEYYKRLPSLVFDINTSTYNSDTALDINGTNWYEIETKTNNNTKFIKLSVGKINSKDGYALENEVGINYKGVIVDDSAQKLILDINATSYIITMDENKDGVADTEIKYVGEISHDDMNAKLGILKDNNITLSNTNAKGHKLYSKTLSTICKINHIDTYGKYSSKANFISQHSDGGYNNLISNRYNNLKVLKFASGSSGRTSGTLVEYDISSKSVTNSNAGTWSEISNVNCTNNSSSITIPTLFELNPTVDGYNSSVGLNNSLDKLDVEYTKAGDTQAIYFFSEIAAKEIIEDLGLTKTPIKKVSLNTTYNYVSFPSNITLCTSRYQSALPSLCDRHHTIKSVFEVDGIEAILKYTGFWSYWEPSIKNNTYNLDKLETISNKEGIVIRASKSLNLKIPYNLYGKIETNVIDLYQSGWFLTSSPIGHTTSDMEDIVKGQGKALKYILHLDNSTPSNAQWNVYAPKNNDQIDQSLPRMNSVPREESFWIYVE